MGEGRKQRKKNQCRDPYSAVEGYKEKLPLTLDASVVEKNSERLEIRASKVIEYPQRIHMALNSKENRNEAGEKTQWLGTCLACANPGWMVV